MPDRSTVDEALRDPAGCARKALDFFVQMAESENLMPDDAPDPLVIMFSGTDKIVSVEIPSSLWDPRRLTERYALLRQIAEFERARAVAIVALGDVQAADGSYREVALVFLHSVFGRHALTRDARRIGTRVVVDGVERSMPGFETDFPIFPEVLRD